MAQALKLGLMEIWKTAAPEILPADYLYSIRAQLAGARAGTGTFQNFPSGSQNCNSQISGSQRGAANEGQPMRGSQFLHRPLT
jgi:hypothetical protein